MWCAKAKRRSRTPGLIRKGHRPRRIPLAPLTTRRQTSRSQRIRRGPTPVPTSRTRTLAPKVTPREAGTVVGMAAPNHREYWNHNTAYHPWLLAIAAEHRGDVLDVGCGDGLLAERLASVSQSVTGIDPDPAAIARATGRLASLPHVTVSRGDFEAYQPGTRRFDLITFVASLHHMDL